MPQPKSSSSRKASSSRASGTRAKSSASGTRAKSASGTRAKSASGTRAKSASGTRKSASSSRARSGGRSASASRRSTPSSPADFSGKSVADFREALRGSVLNPLNLLILSRDRIQEAVDEAVERGRMTREDATELVQGILRQGRKQTNDVLSDLDQLLGRARKSGAVDRVVRSADRARRVAGVGPSFPILGFDELTAAQVATRLEALTPAELRKVRDYERRHGNRKSVLEEIERRLG